MSMSIADRLRSYAGCYPVEIFPKADEDKIKKLHVDYPNIAGRIWAESGRHWAKQALEAADELDRLELRVEFLERKLKIKGE